MTARTRIAPSPTGLGLHIGHIRTMLYDYALAKNTNGQFIVRIEDTDQNRFVEGAVENILKTIKDYGLNYDEGPIVEGPYTPYVQSQRLEIYKKYALELIQKGYAYYCFLTPEETEELQKQARLENKKLRSPYRNTSLEEANTLIEQGKEHVVRLKVPEDEEIIFEDAILGRLKFNSNEVDDQILLKTDGFPTYHLAVVIDDYLMKITHVLRGNDWLSSTPKHILLYRYLGWELPVFAHLPNLKEKNENRKLSKRYGAVFASQFLEQGYLPEALLNFLMLLGWSSPIERKHGEAEKEIYSLQEFVELFSLDRVQKTALVSFDRDKLLWFNKEYIKAKSASDLKDIFLNWFKEHNQDKTLEELVLQDNQLEGKISLIKERAGTLVDILCQLNFFYIKPENTDWNIKQLSAVSEHIDAIRKDLYNLHSSFNDDTKSWSHEEWEKGIRSIGDKYNAKHGDIFMVLRVAIVGMPFSPPLFESLQLMNKEDILSRLYPNF